MNLYELIVADVGNDILEVFGGSGSGKTTFALEVIRTARELGKKVFYIDTERNIKEPLPPEEYAYISSFNDLHRFALQSLPKADLIILDSIGVTALGEYASLDMKQRGEALMRVQSIFYKLKQWTQRNNALAIVLNQPVSDFNKGEGVILGPFGDKGIYYCKEVWKSIMVGSTPEKTVCMIESFRSRLNGRGKRLFKLDISGQGVKIE